MAVRFFSCATAYFKRYGAYILRQTFERGNRRWGSRFITETDTQ